MSQFQPSDVCSLLENCPDKAASELAKDTALVKSLTKVFNVTLELEIAKDRPRDGASLALTLAGMFGGTPVTAMAVTLGNTGYIPSARKVFTGTGSPRTLTNLFPYNDGYDAWGGDCADADPEGKNSSNVNYWGAAQRADPFPVDPNTTGSGTITVGTLQVNFNQSGAADGTDTIIAVHATDAICSGGETLTLTTFPANTGTALIALPFGTWTIKAQGKTGSFPTVAVSPNATGPIVANVNI